MSTNTQSFFDHHTAARAHLRGVGGVHGYNSRTSFFRFVRQQVLELAQPRVMGAQGQVMISRHKLEGQVFQGDQPVGVDQFTGHFMPEITALVGDILMPSSNLFDRLLSTMTAFPAMGHTPLSAPQVNQRNSQPARVFNKLVITQRQQAAQPHIDPNSRSGMCFNDGGRKIQHQANVPLPVTALDNHVFDDSILGEIAVKLNLDIPDVLHIEPDPFTYTQFAAIPVPVFQALKPGGQLEARKTGCFADLHPPKESAEGFVQATQQLLQTGRIKLSECIGLFAAHVSEICPLMRIRKPLTGFLVGRDALLQCLIVNKASLRQQKPQALWFGLWWGTDGTCMCES